MKNPYIERFLNDLEYEKKSIGVEIQKLTNKHKVIREAEVIIRLGLAAKLVAEGDYDGK